MTRNLLLIVALLALATALASSAAYVVNEYDQVVIVRFGQIIGSTVDQPGLHFKLPFIDEARRFDKRWLEWDGDANQVTTSDKRYIYVDSFARWRISDPLKFIELVRDETSAHSRLDDIMDNATRNVIANHNLIELVRSSNRPFTEADEEASLTGAFGGAEHAPEAAAVKPDALVSQGTDDVSTDTTTGGTDTAMGGTDAATDMASAAAQVASAPTGDHLTQDDLGKLGDNRDALYQIVVGREKLIDLILEKAKAKAASFGIELKNVQFRRIDYIESVQQKVFDRMISERRRVAEAFRSQGQGRSAEILGQMEKDLRRIRSEAYRKAEEINGRADGQAAQIYADAYQRDAEFYNFVKVLESYAKTVDAESWLLLSTESDYAKYLHTMDGGKR